METRGLHDIPALLDLSTVEETRRAAVWTGTAPSLFPGLTVSHALDRAPLGNIRCVAMGGGSLWAIGSSPARVHYSPAPDSERHFTLVMQVEGMIEIRQRNRTCQLSAGDLSLLDERFPFELEARGFSGIAFLRMPRQAALGRNPHLEHATAIPLRGAQAGASIVGDTLASAINTAPFMQDKQRSATMTAMIHLLGAVDPSTPESSLGWRVQAALAFVEQHFVRPGLRADEVAADQRISRRRLDQLMLEELGVSITGHIWNRRLEQSAADLRDPAHARRTASEIAYANGFEDPAHFTRAFKRRYGHSPLQWRNLVAEAAH